MKKLKKILEETYSDPEIRSIRVPLFISNPGLGKTQIIEQFAKDKGVQLLRYVSSTRNPNEVSGIAIPNIEEKAMQIFDYDMFKNLRDGDILFFDEFLAGNPATIDACLTLLDARETISGHKLPNIMIVAAGNPQGMRPMLPQIKERMEWIYLDFDQKGWAEYMVNNHLMPMEIAMSLAKLIHIEKFTSEHNFNTARSIDKAVEIIKRGKWSAYSETLNDYLIHKVTNVLDDIKLPNGELLKKGELIPWLTLINYYYETIKK